jgi:hypothetical protein
MQRIWEEISAYQGELLGIHSKMYAVWNGQAHVMLEVLNLIMEQGLKPWVDGRMDRAVPNRRQEPRASIMEIFLG